MTNDAPAPQAETSDEALIATLDDAISHGLMWTPHSTQADSNNAMLRWRGALNALVARLAAKDAALAECRAKVIEECAKVADEHAAEAPVVRDDCDVRFWIEPVAATIRALAKEAPRHDE